MQKIDVVKHILHHTSKNFVNNAGGFAWAPSNVALCKYWGKRDVELNLPVTSSLSVSSGTKGTFTRVKQEGDVDQYFVNGVLVGADTNFFKRLRNFLDLFRPPTAHYLIEINTNVPIAAGFASSACGFASLVQALNRLYGWGLDKKNLSILARLGSGSACRSLFSGFVTWQRGDNLDGMDSFGVKLEYTWPEIRVGMLTISPDEKPISSRDAMQHTVNTSSLYADWPNQVEQDLAKIKSALVHKDFNLLGEIVENNAIAMHATMNDAMPPIVYSLPETKVNMAKIQKMRLHGIPIFFTQDAGPNLQLLFLAENEVEVHQAFPELEIVAPFSPSILKYNDMIDNYTQQIVLIDEQDVEIGTGEKIMVHLQGKLHRAVSVFVLRQRGGDIELLLQQRSAIKYHSANLWSNSCCGHPYSAEDVVIAGERRLYEEMGINVKLKEVGCFHYKANFSDVDLIENEIDHILLGFSDLDDIPFNPLEAQDFCWMKLAELKKDLQINPDIYTVWLQQALDIVMQMC